MLLNLMLFFMITYILFMAGIMRYASAFKAKNALVQMVENATEEVSCEDYKVKLTEIKFDGEFSVEKHHDETKGQSYYTIIINSDMPLIPGLLNIKIPIVGETRQIKDSDVKIAHTNGESVNVYNGSCVFE